VDSKGALVNYREIPFLYTENSVIIKANQRFCDLIQVSSNEILGEDIESVEAKIRCKFNNTGRKNHFIITSRFEPMEVEIETINLSSCEKFFLFRPLLNGKIADNMPLFNHLLEQDNLGMAIFLVPEITLLQANDTYLNFFDSPYNRPENTIGKHISEFVTGWKGSTSEELWKNIIEKQESYHSQEYTYKHLKRGVTYWEASLVPIFVNGNMKYVVEMTRDITDKVNNKLKLEEQAKLIEYQNKQLERNLNIQKEFFSFIAHEFKTPLTVISSTVQLIKLIYKNQLSEKLLRYINKINQSTLQQLRLVSNLLDITKGEAGYLNIERQNLNIIQITRAIVESVNEFAVRKNVKIYFMTEFSEIITAIDDEKYERIILNLLSNAIKFTPGGKSIYVSVGTENGEVTINIKDQGVGIPEDKLGVIFDRFGQVNNKLTREAEGTGIGLSLVKILVEALQGKIKVKSKVGEGSTFTIILPICLVKDAEENTSYELLNDRLVERMNIEFSNIYLEN
jgi:signal transduction histidine kinase